MKENPILGSYEKSKLVSPITKLVSPITIVESGYFVRTGSKEYLFPATRDSAVSSDLVSRLGPVNNFALYQGCEKILTVGDRILMTYKSISEDDSLVTLVNTLADIYPALLKDSFSELDLSVLAYNSLQSTGIETIGDVIQRTREELLEIPRFGKTCLREVVRRLQEHGLRLKDDE